MRRGLWVLGRRLPMPELVEELIAIGRRRSDPTLFSPTLDKVIERCEELSAKGFREACNISHSAEDHLRCVELFHKRAASHAHDATFSLYDVVVDSAFAARSLPAMVAIVEQVRKMPHRTADPTTQLSLLRILWRTACWERQGLCTRDDVVGMARTVWGLLHDGDEAAVSRPVGSAGETLGVADLVRRTRRMLFYNTKDQGEMYFFALCKDAGLVRTVQVDGLPCSATFLALIRSTREGCWAEAAMGYYQEYTALQAQPEELMLYTLVSGLHYAKEYGRVCGVMAPLMQEAQYTPSTAILALTMKSAAETQAQDLALLGLRLAMGRLDHSPMRSELLHCLTALAKCGVPSFESILDTCTANGMVRGEPEELAFLLLTYAMNSPETTGVLERAQKVLDYDATAGVFRHPLTERVATLLLQVYLRVDHRGMVPVFRQCFHDVCGNAPRKLRRHWMELLVVWGDRRRYELDDAARSYIVSVAQQTECRVHEGGATNHPLGMLVHDATHGRCSPAVVVHAGAAPVLASLPPAPEVSDPRVHFLRKRAVLLDSRSSVAGPYGALSVSTARNGLLGSNSSSLHVEGLRRSTSPAAASEDVWAQACATALRRLQSTSNGALRDALLSQP